AARTRDTVDGLEIDPQAMAANLARTGGVLMAERVSFALSPVIGRDEAEAVVAAAAQRALSSGRSFARELGDEPAVVNALGQDNVAERVAELLDPATYLGATDYWIDRALAAYHADRSG